MKCPDHENGEDENLGIPMFFPTIYWFEKIIFQKFISWIIAFPVPQKIEIDYLVLFGGTIKSVGCPNDYFGPQINLRLEKIILDILENLP